MRYLVLIAGMGKRMGPEFARNPKCLIDIAGDAVIARLLRQIRHHDPEADVHVVLGYKSEAVRPLLEGCRTVVNPFFDVTGINASLWFGRDAFDRSLMVIHGDVVLSDTLASRLIAEPAESFVAYDSRILDPGEINVGVKEGRITRFGVHFTGYAGAYAGILKLSAYAARLFATTLDERVQRGFNESRTYYFFVMRRLLADPQVTMQAFDFAPDAWQEIDRVEDLARARAKFEACRP